MSVIMIIISFFYLSSIYKDEDCVDYIIVASSASSMPADKRGG